VHGQLRRFLDPLLDSRLAGTQRGSARLDPQALTIGFARRFATYKRATLFFHDLDRAARILNDPARPVQLVFAGKAHPADMGGQALIRSLVELSERPMFAGKVFFLEGYDMGLARTLVQGCDLWLNNPERPMEASGTSGQKAALNGVPNLSVRDGWWDEGYDGKNGWAFGGEVGNDDVDSADLYRVLEDEVIPAFHTRAAAGLPTAWIATMKEAIRTCAPLYSAQRMVAGLPHIVAIQRSGERCLILIWPFDLLHGARRLLDRHGIRRDHHGHPPTLPERVALHPSNVRHRGGHVREDLPAHVGVGLLPAAQLEGELHAVTLFQPFGDLAQLRVEVVIVRLRTDPHLLDHVLLLGPLGLPLAPGRLVLLAPIVHDPADGWVGLRVDLHQIEASLPGDLQRVDRAHLPERCARIVDNQHDPSPNGLIQADLVSRPAALLRCPHRLPLRRV